MTSVPLPRPAVAALLLWSGLALAGCDCRNSLSRRSASPDGRHDALVYLRDCGGPGGYGVHVSVVPAGSSVPQGLGNAAIVVYRADLSPQGYAQRPPRMFQLRWLDAHHLSIDYDSTVTRVTLTGAPQDSVVTTATPGLRSPGGVIAIP